MNRARQRGVTLVELLVGTLIACFLTAAAFAFAAHESRLMGMSRERVELSQSGRAAIDLIADDLAQAGSGIGYGSTNAAMTEMMVTPCPAGQRCFRGLLTGPFAVRGQPFNAGGAGTQGGVPIWYDLNTITSVGPRGALGATYNMPTQAVGMQMANGSYASIVDFTGTGGVHCFDNPGFGVPIAFRAGELAILRHQDGVFARSVLLSPGANTPHPACRNGGANFTYLADPERVYSSDDPPREPFFLGGEIQGGLKTVVWFITQNAATGSGTLFRAVFDDQNCNPAVIPGCAGAVADFAESLQVRVWAWDTTLAVPAWTLLGHGPITTDDRLRVDVELIVRSRVPGTIQNSTQLQLIDGVCVPGGLACGPTDWGDRRAYRTSIEVINSGRMIMTR